MKLFAELYRVLDSTTRTSVKIAAMVDYFARAQPADAAWAVHFLSGEKLKRLIPGKLLRQWAAEEAGIPTWLFEEPYSLEIWPKQSHWLSLIRDVNQRIHCATGYRIA